MEAHIDEAGLVRGAVRGAVILLGRNLGVQVLAFGATVVLARLLSPSEFGAFAVASVIQQSGMVLVNFGLPAALIRRPGPPTRDELRAVSGFVLVAGTLVALTASLIAFALIPSLGESSEIAKLAAVACFSLPVLGVQIAPIVLLNRGLDFRGVAIIEVIDAVAFYGFAVIGAATGLGPYSLAGAAVLAALVGMVVATAMQPWDRGFTLRLSVLRPLAAFGMQVGAFQSATIARELGFVAMLAALGGQALAGFYGMSRRLFALPYAAMNALQRVGMTTLAQSPAGDSRSDRSAKAIAVGSLAIGLPMALIAGAAEPFTSLAFGDRWLPAAHLTALASPGVLLFACAGTVALSLELADGDARTPLLGIATQLAVLFALGVWLVPGEAAQGAGIALGVSFVVLTAFLLAGTRQLLEASFGPMLRGLLIAAVAALIGRQVVPGGDGAATAASLAATGAIWLGGALLICRTELRLLAALMRRHLRRGPALA
jgi:lipopolysaccharide exporter